ncbi:unnamed protein product [Vitrella brassicaformis CCMP3155]|uniref:PAP-associated domain-containing protein n=7 Tax=Vitrella brassicaformis TaxID=1169539 RepID=A0A0G4FID9_VITBC|nr:unnamed protein product [Vitrella brassicaformis CCMP3155]|eukprot:CEM12872.1 unnamed protein product [Vitrella brassicaformis CCMP3155]
MYQEYQELDEVDERAAVHHRERTLQSYRPSVAFNTDSPRNWVESADSTTAMVAFGQTDGNGRAAMDIVEMLEHIDASEVDSFFARLLAALRQRRAAVLAMGDDRRAVAEKMSEIESTLVGIGDVTARMKHLYTRSMGDFVIELLEAFIQHDKMMPDRKRPQGMSMALLKVLESLICLCDVERRYHVRLFRLVYDLMRGSARPHQPRRSHLPDIAHNRIFSLMSVLYMENHPFVGGGMRELEPLPLRVSPAGQVDTQRIERQLNNLLGEMAPNTADVHAWTDALTRLAEVVDMAFAPFLTDPTSQQPVAKLDLLGSLASGFALKTSDVDVCVQLHPEVKRRLQKRREASVIGGVLPMGEGGEEGYDREVDMEAIEQLQRVLREVHPHEYRAEVIDARVPILKLVFLRGVRSDHMGDLVCIDVSFNNQLGPINSALLRAYAECDPRVLPLGQLVKLWSKARNVNDAHQGTLSSYAYILLLIFFLQTRNPPVLPNLQAPQSPFATSPTPATHTTTNNTTHKPPERWVSSLGSRHNAGFHAPPAFDMGGPSMTIDCGGRSVEVPLPYVPSVQDKPWGAAYKSRNKMSVGQLLFDFFQFYAHEFHFYRDVVSVRLAPAVVPKAKLLQFNKELANISPPTPPYAATHTMRRVEQHNPQQPQQQQPSPASPTMSPPIRILKRGAPASGSSQSPSPSPSPSHDDSGSGSDDLDHAALPQSANASANAAPVLSISDGAVKHLMEVLPHLGWEEARNLLRLTQCDLARAVEHGLKLKTGKHHQQQAMDGGCGGGTGETAGGMGGRERSSTATGSGSDVSDGRDERVQQEGGPQPPVLPSHEQTQQQRDALGDDIERSRSLGQRLPMLCIEDPFEANRMLSPDYKGQEQICEHLRRTLYLLHAMNEASWAPARLREILSPRPVDLQRYGKDDSFWPPIPHSFKEPPHPQPQPSHTHATTVQPRPPPPPHQQHAKHHHHHHQEHQNHQQYHYQHHHQQQQQHRPYMRPPPPPPTHNSSGLPFLTSYDGSIKRGGSDQLHDAVQKAYWSKLHDAGLLGGFGRVVSSGSSSGSSNEEATRQLNQIVASMRMQRPAVGGGGAQLASPSSGNVGVSPTRRDEGLLPIPSPSTHSISNRGPTAVATNDFDPHWGGRPLEPWQPAPSGPSHLPSSSVEWPRSVDTHVRPRNHPPLDRRLGRRMPDAPMASGGGGGGGPPMMQMVGPSMGGRADWTYGVSLDSPSMDGPPPTMQQPSPMQMPPHPDQNHHMPGRPGPPVDDMAPRPFGLGLRDGCIGPQQFPPHINQQPQPHQQHQQRDQQQIGDNTPYSNHSGSDFQQPPPYIQAPPLASPSGVHAQVPPSTSESIASSSPSMSPSGRATTAASAASSSHQSVHPPQHHRVSEVFGPPAEARSLRVFPTSIPLDTHGGALSAGQVDQHIRRIWDEPADQ